MIEDIGQRTKLTCEEGLCETTSGTPAKNCNNEQILL